MNIFPHRYPRSHWVSPRAVKSSAFSVSHCFSISINSSWGHCCCAPGKDTAWYPHSPDPSLWVKSWLLSIPDPASRQCVSARRQIMAQVTRVPATNVGDLEGVPGSWFQLACPSPACYAHLWSEPVDGRLTDGSVALSLSVSSISITPPFK